MIKGKLLRRRVFCRETDFTSKIKPHCKGVGYHRWSWEPISIKRAEEEVTWSILKGQSFPDEYFFGSRDRDFNSWSFTKSNEELFGRRYLLYVRTSGQLYNPRWQHWSWDFKDDGIQIRYFKDKPWATMGIAILERDY